MMRDITTRIPGTSVQTSPPESGAGGLDEKYKSTVCMDAGIHHTASTRVATKATSRLLFVRDTTTRSPAINSTTEVPKVIGYHNDEGPPISGRISRLNSQ